MNMTDIDFDWLYNDPRRFQNDPRKFRYTAVIPMFLAVWKKRSPENKFTKVLGIENFFLCGLFWVSNSVVARSRAWEIRAPEFIKELYISQLEWNKNDISEEDLGGIFLAAGVVAAGIFLFCQAHLLIA